MQPREQPVQPGTVRGGKPTARAGPADGDGRQCVCPRTTGAASCVTAPGPVEPSPRGRTPEPREPERGGAAYTDCGRITSPYAREPLAVRGKGLDCETVRRYAENYLEDRTPPPGWPSDACAASRPACQHGGQGFVVADDR